MINDCPVIYSANSNWKIYQQLKLVVLTFVRANKRTTCCRKAVKTHDNAGQTENLHSKWNVIEMQVDWARSLTCKRMVAESETFVTKQDCLKRHRFVMHDMLSPSLYLYAYVLPNTMSFKENHDLGQQALTVANTANKQKQLTWRIIFFTRNATHCLKKKRNYASGL